MKLAIEHGYKIIRIFQEDIYHNAIDWKHLIKQAVNEMGDESVIYISKKADLYHTHKLK